MKKIDKLIPLTIEGVRVSEIGITIQQDGKVPTISANVQMIMANGSSLTSLQLSTASWVNEDQRLKVDVEVFELIGKLEKALVAPIHRTLNQQQRTLEHQEA